MLIMSAVEVSLIQACAEGHSTDEKGEEGMSDNLVNSFNVWQASSVSLAELSKVMLCEIQRPGGWGT